MRFGPCVSILLALTAPAGPVHASGEVDQRFGTAGMTRLALQPVDGESHDVGVVACARPDGTLFAVGFASGGQRIVSAWYGERGALDLRFSGDGKQSFPIGPDVPYSARGQCLADGTVLLVMEMVDTQLEGTINVWRLDPDTGLPDPAYGEAGRRVLDLDTYAADLAQEESPRGLALGREGDLLIGGLYTLGSSNDRSGGFLARLDAQGTVRAVSLAHQWNPAWDLLVPGGAAADGTLWSAAMRDDPTAIDAQAALLRFDYDTLVYRDSLHAQISVDLTPSQALMLDGATMALAGVRQGGKPLVALLRAEAQQVLQPPLPAGYERVQNVQVAALPGGGRLLFAAAAQDGAGIMRSMAFARLLIGPGLALQADSTFGESGALGSAFPAAAECPGHDSEEVFRRFTYWRGRPTAIGGVVAGCPAATRDYDWMLLRLDLERVFRDGFDPDE